MIHRFTTAHTTARMLTKESKKQKFYFRTLTSTGNADKVYCEVTEPGFDYILKNNVPIEEDPETRVRIGRRLAEIRKSVVWTDSDGNERTGMTQGELAERCGLSQPHITRIENGYYSAGVEKLDDIARAMGYHVDFVKE